MFLSSPFYDQFRLGGYLLLHIVKPFPRRFFLWGAKNRLFFCRRGRTPPRLKCITAVIYGKRRIAVPLTAIRRVPDHIPVGVTVKRLPTNSAVHFFHNENIFLSSRGNNSIRSLSVFGFRFRSGRAQAKDSLSPPLRAVPPHDNIPARGGVCITCG